MGSAEQEHARAQEKLDRSKWHALEGLVMLSVLFFVVVTSLDRDDTAMGRVPVEVGFRTGVSLVTHYGINTTIKHHQLAHTVITMEVANTKGRMFTHGFKLELPKAASVTSLTTVAADDLYMPGEVKAINDLTENYAKAVLLQEVSGGDVELREWDIFNLRVSTPPWSTTIVELAVEQMLREKVSRVRLFLRLLIFCSFRNRFWGVWFGSRHTILDTSPHLANLPIFVSVRIT